MTKTDHEAWQDPQREKAANGARTDRLPVDRGNGHSRHFLDSQHDRLKRNIAFGFAATLVLGAYLIPESAAMERGGRTLCLFAAITFCLAGCSVQVKKAGGPADDR